MQRARVEIKYLYRNRLKTKVLGLLAETRADALTQGLRKLPKGVEYRTIAVRWDNEA